MSDLEHWQSNNAAYLSAALRWLRLRLEQVAEQFVESVPVTLATISAAMPADLARAAASALKHSATSPATPSLMERWLGRRNGQEQVATTPPLLPTAEPTQACAEALLAAEAEMDQAAAIEPPPALIILARRLGLSRFEQQVLLLCAAMELDTRMPTLCAKAQADPARIYPTFALALSLFADTSWDALTPNRPLRYWRLIEINQPGALPLTSSPLRADERIVSYLKGLNQLDDRLNLLLETSGTLRGMDEMDLPPSQQALVEQMLQRISVSRGMPPVMVLVGADGASKQLIATQVARELGLNLCVLSLEALPTHAAELETLLRLWERESLLSPLALYLEARDLDRNGEAQQSAAFAGLRRFLSRSSGLIFLDTRDVTPGLVRRDALTLEVEKPTPIEQRQSWAQAFGDAEDTTVDKLVSQFNLSAVHIHKIARVARETCADANDAHRLHEAAWQTCLMHARPRLDALAQRITPKTTLEGLVLPEREKKKLRQLSAHVRWRHTVYDEFGLRETTQRGLGISALFAGESGTGKTTAAEAIAIALKLNLYRIDLSAVVSKYIGETEKNLRQVFDAAEDGGAILLFDEADALFGKRSEVKDSHDRYANIEIGYLLQRMEAYNGLAILTTNLKSALDPAFVRRLRFIVDFPFPGPLERQQIWQHAFPPRIRLAPDLDVERLARFNLSGGGIHNAAVHAAFMAAQGDGVLTMAQVVEAAQDELLKMNRPMQTV